MGNLESMKKISRNVQSPKTKHRKKKNRNMNKSVTISESKKKPNLPTNKVLGQYNFKKELIIPNI